MTVTADTDKGSVTLFTHGLLSKWGFDDGSALSDVLWDWEDRESIKPFTIDVRAVLVRVVREFLLPKLDQKVEVETLGTSHNPIRATTVNGVAVPYGVTYGTDPEPTLTPESVDVAIDDIIRIAREVLAAVDGKGRQ